MISGKEVARNVPQAVHGSQLTADECGRRVAGQQKGRSAQGGLRIAALLRVDVQVAISLFQRLRPRLEPKAAGYH